MASRQQIPTINDASRGRRSASIIINNYNYARFLPQAIESALAQEYRNTEVIVVDDGSTDNSREVIAKYGSRIRPVLKRNGGQASALNAGFAASRGEVILFLDADDILFPAAVANVVPLATAGGVSKVHWPMWIIDASGARTGDTRPNQVPPEGDLRQKVLHCGPSNVSSSPTSGNAWSRSFLERVMPIPEDVGYYRLCADEYLYTLAPVFGCVRTIADPQGCYRIHGSNVYSSRSFRERLELELSGYDEQCTALVRALDRNRIPVDVTSWRRHSWFHRLERAVMDLLHTIPQGSNFVLIDGNTWGLAGELDGRRVLPFLDHDGIDWGPPSNDQCAVSRLQVLRAQEVQFLVITWPCFWWLDEYPAFFHRLGREAKCTLWNDSLLIFDLRRLTTPIASASSRAPEEGIGDG